MTLAEATWLDLHEGNSAPHWRLGQDCNTPIAKKTFTQSQDVSIRNNGSNLAISFAKNTRVKRVTAVDVNGRRMDVYGGDDGVNAWGDETDSNPSLRQQHNGDGITTGASRTFSMQMPNLKTGLYIFYIQTDVGDYTVKYVMR
jgi:hypothetical protein